LSTGFDKFYNIFLFLILIGYQKYVLETVIVKLRYIAVVIKAEIILNSSFRERKFGGAIPIGKKVSSLCHYRYIAQFDGADLQNIVLTPKSNL